MKTTSDLTAPVQTRGDFRRMSESSSEGERRHSELPDLPDEHPLWELWGLLAEFYPNFVSQCGEQPTWAWYGALRDLSAADYGVGMNALKNRNSPFPPNPGEFFALCRPESPAQQRNRLGTARPRLPAPYLTHEQAKPYLAKIREVLA